MSTGAAHWLPAYVGIGSNLDDPGRHVRRAVDDIAAMTGVCCVSVSSLYRSAPMGPADQPDFVNAVVAMLTTRTARELLSGLQSIETTHGRVRSGERWGPRTLDLDILVYGGQVINEPDLTVPHPGMANRNFVLLPLEELAPDLYVPGLGCVSSLADRVADAGPALVKLDT